MNIIACPRCGSRKIYQGTMGDGVLSGFASRDVCRNCGYQGMPIIFDSEEEYKKFLSEKNLKKKSNQKNEDEEFKNQQRPIGLVILSIIIILIAIISIYLYYHLLLFDVNNLLWIYYISIFILSALILPYGFFRGRTWALIIGTILFFLAIPIGLFFLYYITRPRVKAYFKK